MAVELSDRVQDWQRRGRTESVLGHDIHTVSQDGESPCLLLLHGVPSSSYDWRRLVDVEDRQALLTFDLLGFGLSDKPRDHDYSLQEQTDLAEELVERFVGSDPYFIVAHDLGTSVATELMARDIEGRLRGNPSGALLLNRSIILERARRRAGMKILRGPLGPVMARAMTGRLYRRQFDQLFSPAIRPRRRRPTTSGRSSSTGAASGSRTRSRTWTTASAMPTAGAAPSATGTSHSASSGGCSTRWRCRRCSRACVSCAPTPR